MVGNNRQYAMGLSWNGGGAHVFCYWIIYMGLAQNWVPDGTRGFEIWWFWVVSHPTFWLFGLTKLNHCSLWLYRLVPFGSKKQYGQMTRLLQTIFLG